MLPQPHSTTSAAPDAAASVGDADLGVWWWEAETDCLDLEPYWAQCFGLPAGPIAHGAWLAVLSTDDRARMQRAWDTALGTLSPVEWTMTCQHEGRARLLRARARRIPGPAGGLHGVLFDDTGAASAPRGQTISESIPDAWADVRAFVDALPALVWSAQADGRPEYLNATLRAYVGQASEAPWESAIHPDDLVALHARWLVSLRRVRPFEARCRLRRDADGAWRWHIVRASPMRDDVGRVGRWIGSLVDVHDFHTLVEAHQHVLAAEQQAREAADDAARLKDEFLATLAHELRTPLNAIAGWVGLLRQPALSPADRGRAVEVIERNAQAQRQLIEALLDTSRIISGHVRLDHQLVALDDLIARDIQARRPVIDARGVRVDVLVDPHLPLVWGDAARLRQVCEHLLANAVNFTPAGGTVRVTLATRGPRVCLEVADTGIGIPADFLPFVFDRFRRADLPAARRHGGLGLGLTITRRLVEMHGGDIAVASDGEGQGTTVTVTFAAAAPEIPADTSEHEGPGASEPVVAPLRGQSILVIEDDADSREMLSVLLENAGGVPVGAATVADGLRLLGDLQIDVVLSDIGMPDRDGFDLIRALRSFPHPRVRRAPAIAVTAFSRAEDRARVLAAGFDAHVPKPVEPARLLAAIVEVCRRRHEAVQPPPPA